MIESFSNVENQLLYSDCRYDWLYRLGVCRIRHGAEFQTFASDADFDSDNNVLF